MTNLFIMSKGVKPGDIPIPTPATGVLVDNPGGYSTSDSVISVDTVDPRKRFMVGDSVGDSNGDLLGTIASMTDDSITFNSNILIAISQNEQLILYGSSSNVYYDTPTNPLIICDDTLTADTTVACYEIRNNNSLSKMGEPVATGVISNASHTSGSSIAVKTIDPRLHFKIGHNVYLSAGTFIGKIQSIQYDSPTVGKWGITFEEAIAATVGLDVALFTSRGVSNAHSYNILNRIYPDTAATSEIYLENLENTEGYKILCAKYASNATTKLLGENISSINLTTDDYFVMLNSDNPLTHHFAKITKVTTSDVAGDGFEFSPKYGSEIPKGTKFTIWKGPPVTDTDVVAVSYGLYGNAISYGSDSDETDGTGTATDSRHSGLTYLSKPLFYFYNDRLNKPNELDHNTKYMLHYSRSDDGTETHYKRCFLTCQDYGLKVVDYGPYSMNATMVDVAREYDALQFSSTNDFSYALDDSGAGKAKSYGADMANWDECFINNQRHNLDLKFGETSYGTTSGYIPEGSFNGPTKYLHYDTSPDLNNIVPEVIGLNVFESINEVGGYADIRIVDSKRIYGSKIKEHDNITIKKLVATGSLSNDYIGLLPGSIETAYSPGDTTFTVSLTNNKQDLRVLLGNPAVERVKIGNYVYKITNIAAPNTTSNTQEIQISSRRLSTSAFEDASVTGFGENIAIGTKLYRKPWSKHCENLIVDFTIDTTVNYSSPGTSINVDTIVYGDNATLISSESGSRLYNSELILSDNNQSGMSFKIDYGDSNHNIIKLQEPRLQLYRLETANEANFLDYYNGNFSVYKIIFSGEVETLENYVENGMMKYHLAGRNKINKLLGPIVNKNYNHSDDIIYSTFGPVFNMGDSGHDANVSPATHVQSFTYDGSSSSLETGIGFSSIFKENGSLIGKVYNPTGGTILFEGDVLGKSKISIDNNDSIYQGLKTRNLISFSKALEANPKLTTSPASLLGTSNKGLFFTGGQKLNTDVYGVPTTEISSLVGTSAHSHSNALGYHINYPTGINPGIDLPFMAQLKDELENEYDVINTVNSLTEYQIIKVDSNENSSTIELAPNCPIVMGRIDHNPEDIRFETLTATTINIDQSYSKGHNNAIEIDDTYSATNSAIANKYVYTSDGTLLGKVLYVFDDGYGSMGCAIVLDRPLPVAVTISTILYTSTSKTHGLYLINTQGLRNGGVLQLTNSILDHAFRPTIFNTIQASDGTQTGTTNYCAIDRYGSYNWRYLDLQKGKRGAISYAKRQSISGDLTDIYSAQLGEFMAYAPSFRFNPGTVTGINLIDFNYDSDYSNDYQKMGSHETRNVYPVLGSNFADYDKYSSNSATHPIEYTLIPKVRSDTLGGPWNINTLGARVDTGPAENATGYKANAVKAARDRLEIIDPKVITPFLFTTADLYPDSITRTNHISNVERDFSNYSIMLKSKPTQTKSSVNHDNYDGQLNHLELSNDSYETLQISSASIKTNQMRRLGLMRLTEITFDWHFNMIDPENIKPQAKNNVPYFKYARYQKLTDSDRSISSISGADIVCDSSTNLSARFPDDTYVFDSNGNFLGEVDSITSATITCKANVKQVNGTTASGDLYYIEKGEADNNSYHEYALGGRDGDGSFTNFSVEASKSISDADNNWDNTPRPLNMLQMGIFNGYGATGHTLVDSTTSDEGYNNEGYGNDTNTSFKKYFVRKLDMAASHHDRGFLNHLILPPVFEGFLLDKLTESDGTRIWAARSGSATTITSGSSFKTSCDGNRVNTLLDPGDRIYTDNGEYIGTFNNCPTTSTAGTIIIRDGDVQTTIHEDASLTTHTTGTLLCKGGSIFDSRDIGIGPLNSGGGHALASKKLIAKYGDVATANLPNAEYVHPSKVLEGIFNYLEDTTLPNPYSWLRAVALTSHRIENSKGMLGHDNDVNIQPKIEPGLSAQINTTTDSGLSGQDNDQTLKLKMGSNKDQSVKDIAPMLIGARLHDSYTYPDGFSSHPDFRGEFAKWTRTKSAAGSPLKNRGKGSSGALCDGGEFVFKPIFNTEAAHTAGNVSYSTNTPNGSSIGRIRIRPDTDFKMAWLAYSPNLTGCYLVSTQGNGFLGGTSSDNLFTESTYDIIPNTISYIISHEISRTDSVIYHDFLVDNMAVGTRKNNYKIMRPNQVCFYPDSPLEIDLYKLDFGYTKMANSDKMYPYIPHLRIYENGWKVNDTGEPDYGEGIQSMYVVVNPDHTSTEEYLIPRGTSSNHHAKLFGDEKTFEDGTYDILVNDGINQERKDIKIWDTGIYTKLTFTEKFKDKMSGIVSLGEVFSVTTSRPISLNEVETASIGTGVTIGSETEEIINDMLEQNDIIYDNSEITYPYFTAPNFQGSDVYNSAKFLSLFKDKQLLIDKDEIKLIATNSSTRYTDIEINEEDEELKILEIQQNKSGFDIYNEIIIYGDGVQSIKRNVRSIKKIGKKTLEEFHEKLSTQAEVDNKSKELLNFYNRSQKSVTVKLANKKVEWIKSGDIIVIDYPSEHIPRGDYMVLEVKHEADGSITIQAGGYSKALDSRLAEIIVHNKRMASFLRSDRFKSSSIQYNDFGTIKLKPIQLTISKTTVSGHTAMGLSTTMRFGTLFGIGTRSTTTTIIEDLI